MTITLPAILNLPPKMLPMITNFNDYVYFLGDGGRGSSKTQSVGRFMLFLGDHYKLRICCGREIQNTIGDSVKTVLETLINEFNLNYTIKDKEIINNETGTIFIFKGFREQGKVNIKGLADVDILWIDEAESITKATLDVIVPTIMRKKNARIFFTMNRFVRNDAVYMFCVGRPDCLHININYFDNPFLTEQMLKEAEIQKAKNIKDYEHIWLGLPIDQAHDFLIAASKIEYAKSLTYQPENIKHHSVMSVDLAASGSDLNVMKLLKQQTATIWDEAITEKWSEADTDITIGKIIALYAQHKPDILIIDADGVGYSMVNTIKKAIPNCIAFRGGGLVKNKLSTNAKNARAEGYLTLKEFINNGWLKLNDENACRQLEYLKVVYKPGYVVMASKDDIRKEQHESPDFADALMMAIYAIDKYPHMMYDGESSSDTGRVITDFNPFE